MHAVAELARLEREHAAELAAAEHADRGAGREKGRVRHLVKNPATVMDCRYWVALL
jgi:hypothetical protein